MILLVVGFDAAYKKCIKPRRVTHDDVEEMGETRRAMKSNGDVEEMGGIDNVAMTTGVSGGKSGECCKSHND